MKGKKEGLQEGLEKGLIKAKKMLSRVLCYPYQVWSITKRAWRKDRKIESTDDIQTLDDMLKRVALAGKIEEIF